MHHNVTFYIDYAVQKFTDLCKHTISIYKHVWSSAHAYYNVCTSATMQVFILTQTFVFNPPEMPGASVLVARE